MQHRHHNPRGIIRLDGVQFQHPWQYQIHQSSGLQNISQPDSCCSLSTLVEEGESGHPSPARMVRVRGRDRVGLTSTASPRPLTVWRKHNVATTGLYVATQTLSVPPMSTLSSPPDGAPPLVTTALRVSRYSRAVTRSTTSSSTSWLSVLSSSKPGLSRTLLVITSMRKTALIISNK